MEEHTKARQDAADASAVTRSAQVVRRAAVRVASGFGVAIAVALSLVIAFSGTRKRLEAPRLPVTAQIETGRWRVAVRGVAATSRLPDGRTVPAGREALVLEAELDNLTATSSNAYTSLFKVESPAPGMDPSPTFYLLRDRALLWELQPGLAEAVAVVWTLPAGAPVPDRVTIAIEGETYKARDNLYAAPGWYNAHVVGTVELPVTRS